MDELIKVVNSVGFPIVAYFMMTRQVASLHNIITDLSTTLKSIDTRLTMLEEKREG